MRNKLIRLFLILVLCEQLTGQRSNANYEVISADSLVGVNGKNYFLNNVKVRINGEVYLVDKVLVDEKRKKIIISRRGYKRKFRIRSI